MIVELQTKLTEIFAEHSRKITLAGGGVLAGILLLLIVFWVVDIIMAPPVPDMSSAAPATVASFMANPRGFTRMPLNDKRQMLFDLYKSGPDELSALGDEFARLTTEERDQVRSAALDVALDQLVRDAKIYRRLRPNERDAFVEEALGRFEALREQLHEVGDSFKDNLPTKEDQFTKALVTKTTPRQRSLVKPLVDHITKAAEKKRRGEQSSRRRSSRRR